eukprot:Selendium_serpulae@DN5015_c0_g1_i1.p1
MDPITGEKTRIGMSHLGALEMEGMSEMMRKGLAFRQQNVERSNKQIIDIQYDDLVKDPIKTVSKIYKKFNIPFTTKAKNAMTQFLAENQKNRDKLLKHHYSLALEGISAKSVEEQFAEYYSSGYLVAKRGDDKKGDDKKNEDRQTEDKK